MKFIVLFAMLLSSQAFAAKMGPKAVEIFSLMSKPAVQECLERNSVSSNLMNLSIDKLSARCQGCFRYTISGNKRNIDTPSTEKTVITITSTRVIGFGGQPAQKIECEVQN